MKGMRATPCGPSPEAESARALRERLHTLEAELERTERYMDQRERVLAANARELRDIAADLRQARDRLQAKTEELERANARLGELDRLKSAFLASVSHELRTPLTTIVVAARLLQRSLARPRRGGERGHAADRSEANADVIVDEAERLGRLIQDILDLARIEAGRAEWRFAALEPAGFVAPAAAGVAPLFREWGVELAVDVPGDLPCVRADRDGMIRVLANLLGNAGKFTPAGGRVRLTARPATLAPNRGPAGGEPRPFVLVSVRDSGRGIGGDDLARIFQKFARGGEPPPGRPSGSGLGLAIAREIVEAHGGWIWAVSEPGHGSTFSFTIPVAAVGGERAERATDGAGRA
jgi:signal transduction histidine kinase